MDNVPQSEGWKQLGLALEAVHEGDSWTIMVRRPSISKGHIRFRVKTRLEYGQLDPHDAFLGFCETLAGLPTDYATWLNLAGLPDTDLYRSRYQELVRQKTATIDAFGHELISAVASLRPAGQTKRVLPALSTGVRPTNLRPTEGVQVP